MFELTLLEASVEGKQRGAWAWGLSVLLQVVLVSGLTLVPLLYPEMLPKRLLVSLLAAPAGPPPAPAKPPGDAAPKKRVQFEFEQGELLAPVRIPETVPVITDEVPHTPTVLVTSAGGVEGGTGSGIVSILKIPYCPPLTSPPPPPPVKPGGVRPIQVGEIVQQAKLLSQQKPHYPALARQARISGIVRLTAIISKSGTIEQLRVISGHPLLVKAALEAVKRWRYRPTILNGQPVRVETTVDVIFTLSR